jgi:hypothetical protein
LLFADHFQAAARQGARRNHVAQRRDHRNSRDFRGVAAITVESS